eukprot:2422463-Pyramimonas_sp.AAC.1
MFTKLGTRFLYGCGSRAIMSWKAQSVALITEGSCGSAKGRKDTQGKSRKNRSHTRICSDDQMVH